MREEHNFSCTLSSLRKAHETSRNGLDAQNRVAALAFHFVIFLFTWHWFPRTPYARLSSYVAEPPWRLVLDFVLTTTQNLSSLLHCVFSWLLASKYLKPAHSLITSFCNAVTLQKVIDAKCKELRSKKKKS
ncbi:T7N9.19 [Arabidopsis thaliana]|uniref:T7N9.19 n=1 Tax=Arabidopsis thaliana TaxID=3702 RepID=Q9LFX5_ARATH|nr:T7N9.19 [Arabidopsis thaliana]